MCTIALLSLYGTKLQYWIFQGPETEKHGKEPAIDCSGIDAELGSSFTCATNALSMG